MDFAEDWADITTNWFYWTETEEELFKEVLNRFNITADNYTREGVVGVIGQHIITKTREEIRTHLDEHFNKKEEYGLYNDHNHVFDLDMMNEFNPMFVPNPQQNKRMYEPNIFDSNSNDGTYLHSSNMLHSMNNLDHDLTSKSPQPQDSMLHHQLEDFQLDQNQYEMNQKILQSNLESQEKSESSQPEKPVENKRKRPLKETVVATNKKAATKATKATKVAPVTKKPPVVAPKKKTPKATTGEKQEFAVEEKFFQDWYVDTPQHLLPLKSLLDKNQVILKQLITGLKDLDPVNQKILMKHFYDNYNKILQLFEDSGLKEKAPELPSSLNTYFITDLIEDKIN